MLTSPKLKLIYFNGAGRAEAIRLAFFIGGVPFEDARLDADALAALKPGLPYGQVPVLEVDGEVLAQSQGILRFAGRLANLYPSNDALVGLKIDEVMTGMEDLLEKLVPSFYEQDLEKKKVMREAIVKESMPLQLKRVNDRLAKMSSCAAFQTGDIFIHEVTIFSFLRWMQSGAVDHVPATIADGFPSLTAVMDKVSAHPKVKQWYATSRTEAPKIKLTYFPLGGRAEPIRLAFAIGGVEFEDKRIGFEEFGSLAKTLPYGQLPVLEVDGEVMAQSESILRFAGIKSGLYPDNDPVQALRIDELLGAVEELFTPVKPTFALPREEMLAARQKLSETTFPKLLAGVNKRLAAYNQVYAVGDVLSIADLLVYGLVSHLRTGLWEGVAKDVAEPYDQLLRITEQVAAHEKVKEWYSKPHE